MPQTSEPVAVNIGEIRSQLRAMWASEAMHQDAVIRASTHNLIVFVADHAAAEETTQRIIELTADRPGRVILIDVEPGDEDRVDSWVTTYCRTVGKKQICGELITLAVRGSLREEIHSTVISLLSPDLPVYLWWTSDLNANDQLFGRLSQNADRVLVDTSLFGSDAQGLSEVAILPKELPTGDLNWARLTVWRQLLAQLWDMGTLQQPLRTIQSIEIEYAASNKHQDGERALLMTGWLADTFEWELASAQRKIDGGYVAQWRKGDWAGQISLIEARRTDLPSGEITNIHIEAGQKAPFVRPRLFLNADLGCIETITSDSEDASHSMCRFKPVSISAALAEEIDLGYDPVYRHALNRAVEILTACGKLEDHT